MPNDDHSVRMGDKADPSPAIGRSEGILVEEIQSYT